MADQTKRELRVRLLARRRTRTAEERAEASAAWSARFLELPEVLTASTVAAYLSTDEELDTSVVLNQLLDWGLPVLLPILRPDFDLEWGNYDPEQLREGRFGLVEPGTSSRGVDAISAADIVVCPGLAADQAGRRLGRGGGSYDRALTRVRPGALTCLPLYDDEVLPEVPTDDHDQRVQLIITPTRTIRTSPRNHS